MPATGAALSPREYHLGELNTALDPTHPQHLLPVVGGARKVLDVGCGAGQTLIPACPDRVSFGVDVDLEALRLGRTLTDRVRFACASAEALPYRDGWFDFAIARVSLPYTNLGASLGEIRRVLAPGGTLWMALHPFAILWKQVKESNFKGRVYCGYVLANSMLFHFAGRQFRLLGRCESFQTERGVRRALERRGFTRIVVTRRGNQFLVTAHVPR